MSRDGREARATVSDPVRPSSAAQPSMCGQSRWPSCRSASPAVSARIIAVMAVKRSMIWPGSQDTSHSCWRPGACRAVWPVWSLPLTPDLHSHRIPRRQGSRRIRRHWPDRSHLALGPARRRIRADKPHGLVTVRRRQAAIGRYSRHGTRRRRAAAARAHPRPELNKARFICWLCTSDPGDEVPLRFRPWETAPAPGVTEDGPVTVTMREISSRPTARPW